MKTSGKCRGLKLRGIGERAFAGGASDGVIGCAGMDFARGPLTGRKSWFLFEDGVVALGAGITASGAAPVRTTINQCHRRGPVWLRGQDQPLADGTHALTAGTAFWHDGVSYLVLRGEGTLRLGPQTGAWSDCGVGSPERVELPVLNVGLEHGHAPQAAEYAYAIRPGCGRDAAFATPASCATIVRNDAQLQAVWHTRELRGHAVFFAPGSVTFPDHQRVEVDRPCILLYHPGGGHAVLTLADPQQTAGNLTLTLAGPLRATIGVSLPAREYAGSSITLTLAG